MLIGKDHVSRKRSDTYYITKDILLRPHVTANEKQMFNAGHEAFLIFGTNFFNIIYVINNLFFLKKKRWML